MNEEMKKMIWRISTALILALLLFCCCFVLVRSDGAPPMPELPPITEEPATEPVTEPETTEEETTAPPLADNPVNFDYYAEINPDIYAWLVVPGTPIDYAVLQHPEIVDYYHRRNYLGNYDVCGCIFTELYNSRDFTDPNTLIYGHYMWDGTFFGPLHQFRDPEFFEENRYFYIYIPGHILTYEIFAAYENDDRHQMLCFDYEDEEVFAEYIENCLAPESPVSPGKNLREGVEITTDDRIVTLSTCLENADMNKRFFVQGVLINDELTN